MHQYCQGIPLPKFLRRQKRMWLCSAFTIGCLFSAPVYAQDEPNPQPTSTVPPTVAPKPIRGPFVPNLYADSMWGSAMDPPSRKITRWYGWQQMIPLVAADVMFVAAWLNNSNIDGIRASLVIGPAVHLFAGPIVHWAHGDFEKGVKAFGMNLLLPGTAILGITIGLEVGAFRSIGSIGFPLMIGFSAVGFLGAQTFDIAYLSHETVRVPLDAPKNARTWLPSSIAVLPLVDTNTRGLMLAGQF